ncbi:MAG: DUF177 domain-containing protein [Myxococcota bacterium]
MSALIIHLEDVKESPRDFRLTYEAGWWEETRERRLEPDVPLRTPFELHLSGYRIGARLLFRGEAVGAVELPCARCAEPYVHDFREPIELLLEPARAHDVIGEGGLELDPDEPGLAHYAGDELDFTPVLLELLVLEWPMQPRCREDCRGLCPVCGGNRNLQRCACEAQPGLRPFAALGSLIAQSRQGRR